jgi:cobyrinic acid a,c-diamide synthase
MSGLLIAAPSSGSGKTTITLGLLRALRNRGVQIAPGKAGPDYIDPAFHTAASGAPCLNFDPWAMRRELISANAAIHRQGDRILVIEAMMGLFDGAADGKGTAADLAAMLGLSVVSMPRACRSRLRRWSAASRASGRMSASPASSSTRSAASVTR